MLIQKTLEHRVLPVPFHILTFSGIWCPEYVKPWFKQAYSIFTWMVIVLEIVLAIESAVYLVIVMQSHHFDMDVFFILTSLINGLYKALNILLARRRIQKLLIRGFGDRWLKPRDGLEKVILETSFSEGWRIHLIYAVACVVGVLLKLLGPILKSNSDLELPTAAWQPYDTNKFWFFWLSYVQQLFVGGAIISMHIGADTMLSGLMLQSCVQLKLLKHRLKMLFHRHDKAVQLASLSISDESLLIKRCIRDHQLVYSFVKTLNEDFGGWLIALLTVVIPNICINVYYLSFAKIGLNIDFLTSLGLFSISLFQIYLPCWYGNEVMLHSTEIGSAAYEMNWINLTPISRKALIIIMLRASKPIRITAAHVLPMNIKSFLHIMKTSYSVLSVLQQT